MKKINLIIFLFMISNVQLFNGMEIDAKIKELEKKLKENNEEVQFLKERETFFKMMDEEENLKKAVECNKFYKSMSDDLRSECTERLLKKFDSGQRVFRDLAFFEVVQEMLKEKKSKSLLKRWLCSCRKKQKSE